METERLLHRQTTWTSGYTSTERIVIFRGRDLALRVATFPEWGYRPITPEHTWLRPSKVERCTRREAARLTRLFRGPVPPDQWTERDRAAVAVATEGPPAHLASGFGNRSEPQLIHTSLSAVDLATKLARVWGEDDVVVDGVHYLFDYTRQGCCPGCEVEGELQAGHSKCVRPPVGYICSHLADHGWVWVPRDGQPTLRGTRPARAGGAS